MTIEMPVKMNWHDYLQILEDTIQNVSDMQRMISSNNLQKNNLMDDKCKMIWNMNLHGQHFALYQV